MFSSWDAVEREVGANCGRGEEEEESGFDVDFREGEEVVVGVELGRSGGGEERRRGGCGGGGGGRNTILR